MHKQLIGFDIDDYVIVKLTPTGYNILSDEYKEIMNNYPNLNVDYHQYLKTNFEDAEDGWTRWKLVELTQTFGKYMFDRVHQPFENSIKFEVIKYGQ